MTTDEPLSEDTKKERARCAKWAQKLRGGEIDDIRSLIAAIVGGWDPDKEDEP